MRNWQLSYARRMALLVAAIATAAACQKNWQGNQPPARDPPEAPRSDYAPLSNKSRWTYSVEYRGPFGGVQTGKMVRRVDGKETIQGKTYYKIVTVFSGIPGIEPDVSYLRLSKDGTWKIMGKHKDKPECLVSAPSLDVGTTWTVTDPEGKRKEYRVVGKETAELFDRKYENCLKISFQGTTREIFASKMEGYEYLAPGIGCVKEVWSNGLVTIELTLDTYEP